MIFVIDDDEIMAECIARACGAGTQIFQNAYAAMNAIVDGTIPDLIFLDILLDGPDGFTFLNELITYDDTAKIPVVIVTSLELNNDLNVYGVVEILNKTTMTPNDIKRICEKYV